MSIDDDALTRALIMAGIGMIGAPTLAQGISRGGMFGMQGYDQALDMRDKRAQRAMQQQMEALQLATAQRGYNQQSAIDAAAQRAYTPAQPGVTPLTPNDDEGNPMPASAARPAGFNLPQFSADMFGIDPIKGIAFRQSLAKESDFGKVDAKDYTPESVKRFQLTVQGGAPDYSVLVPRSKKEFVNGVAVDPYEAKVGSVVDSPFADVVRDPKTGNWMFNPAKINPLERQRVGIDAAGLKLRQDEFNRGVLHDFPTADGGTSLGFVTPGGVTAVPGSGEKKPEVPAAIRTQLAQNNVTLNKIDRAFTALDDHPEAFGVKNALPYADAVRQRTNPEGVEARALIADIGSQKLHDRSGASVTINEMPRLAPFVPNQTDNTETIRKKLSLLKQEYTQMQSELQGGKSIGEVAAPKSSPTSGRTPSIAEIQAEMMRRGRGGGSL